MREIRYGFDRSRYREQRLAQMDYTDFVKAAVVVVTGEGKRYVNLFNGDFVQQGDTSDTVCAQWVYNDAKCVLNQRMVVIARRRYWDRELNRVRLLPKEAARARSAVW